MKLTGTSLSKSRMCVCLLACLFGQTITKTHFTRNSPRTESTFSLWLLKCSLVPRPVMPPDLIAYGMLKQKRKTWEIFSRAR